MSVLPVGKLFGLFRIGFCVTLEVWVRESVSAWVHMYTVGCQPLLHTLLVLCLVKHHNYKVIQVICLSVVK